MKIKSIEPIAVSLPMLKPVIMAGEEVRRADNVLVRVETDTGMVGWGEAASAPVMTGDTLESIVSAVHYLSSALRGRDPADIAGAHVASRSASLWNIGQDREGRVVDPRIGRAENAIQVGSEAILVSGHH